MAHRYFVRLAGEREIVFEEVSEAVYNRREDALNDAGKSRYGTQRFLVNGRDFVECVLGGLNIDVVAHIMRLFSIPTNNGATGFIRIPTHIKMQGQRGSVSLFEVASGDEFKLVMKKAA